jgi:capsular polysaccharide biosynthesis protein
MILGAAAGYGASTLMDPVYQAKTSVIVGQVLIDPSLTAEELDTSQQLSVTYADMIRRQPVLEAAARALRLDVPWRQLQQRVHAAASPRESQLIVITAESGSPREASELAEAIADQVIALSPTESEYEVARGIHEFVMSRLQTLQQGISQLESRIASLRTELALTTAPTRAVELHARIERNERRIIEWQSNYSALLDSRVGEGVPNFLQVFEQVQASSKPVRPNTALNVGLGTGFGLLLALVIGYVLEFRRHEEEEEEPEAWPRLQGRSQRELVETVRRSSRELGELATELTDDAATTEAWSADGGHRSQRVSASPQHVSGERFAYPRPARPRLRRRG